MKKITLIITAMFFAFCLNATVYFVSPQGSGVGGTTWTTACNTISAALDSAKSGDEIWVKQGTYTITTTLQMIDGVNVYGGFDGTETTLSERSKDASLTIVDGSGSCMVVLGVYQGASVETIWDGLTITNGRSTHGAGVYLRGNNTLHNCIISNCTSLSSEGSYGSQGTGVYISCGSTLPGKLISCKIIGNKMMTVQTASRVMGGAGVHVASGSSAALIDSCVIDGNVIEGRVSSSNISGMGAGVQIYAGTISNTEITNNTVTDTLGQTGRNRMTCGGIHVVPETSDNTVTISNCKIAGNSSETGRGGAILIDPYWGGTAYLGTYTFENCVIDDNSTIDVGAGCLITTVDDQASGFTTTFNNCVFSNNTSGGTGSAIFNNSAGSNILNMNNCTVVRNHGQNAYAGQVRLNTVSNYNLTNCIIWGNKYNTTLSTDKQLQIQSGSTATVTNCAIENAKGAGYNGATVTDTLSLSADNTGSESGVNYVCFEDPSTTAGMDGAGDYDWHLSQYSDCIDKGTSVVLTVDIEGNTRPTAGVKGGTALFDIGAYEFVPDISTRIKEKNDHVSSLKAYSIENKIVVELPETVEVKVFNIQGQIVKSFVASQELNIITVANNGLYIVRAGVQTEKVIVY